MNQTYPMTGSPGTTTQIVTNDAVVRLGAGAIAEKTTGFLAVEITILGNPIRYSWGADPTQGGSGVGSGHVLPVGGALRIANRYGATDLRMINQNNGAQSEISYTVEFAA